MHRPIYIKILLALTIASLTISPSFAKQKSGWIDRQGKPQKDITWRQSKNNFGAMLFATDDLPAFKKAWYRPASPDYIPKIPTTQSAKTNETITLLLMFAGCTANNKGKCKLVGKLKIIDPKGTIIHKQKVTFYDAKQPPKKVTLVSPVMVGFAIDNKEPTGTYIFEYQITDAYANTTLNLTQKVLFSK